MGNTKTYDYIPLNSDNVHLLVDLYKQVFGIHYTIEQVKIKYQPAYTGMHAQGHFAFHKGNAVAFHGAIPMFMRSGNTVELCAQYGDAMTLKAHTGKGLFTKLGELTDQLLISNEVKFVWGFPNQNSEYGYINKLHWTGQERMQCYIFKLRSISREQVLRKSKVLQKQNQEQIKKKLAGLILPKEDLHSINYSQHGGIDRSKEFYAYKSFTPNYFVQVNSTKVWIKPVGGLLVGDMEIKDEGQLINTVDQLKDLAKKLGLSKLVIQASPKSQLNSILKKHYQPIDSWLIGFKDFNSKLDLNKLQFTYGDLDTF